MCPHRPSSAQTPPYLLESPPSFGLCIELLADVRCLPRGAGFVVLGLSACATQFLVVDDSHEKTRSVVRTPLHSLFRLFPAIAFFRVAKKERPSSKKFPAPFIKIVKTAWILLLPCFVSQDQTASLAIRWQAADIGWCRVRAYSYSCVAREEA
jgi:hypothetical protein